MDAEENEPLWTGAWQELTVTVPQAASLLCVSPHTVGQLIEGRYLEAQERGNFRFVTLVSLFAYRSRYWSPERATRYKATLDATMTLGQANERLTG